jgi:hypothetical protein
MGNGGAFTRSLIKTKMNSIPFQFDTKYGQFSDALVLTDEELAELSESDIEAMKQQRLSNWIAVIETPQEYVDETVTLEIPQE